MLDLSDEAPANQARVLVIFQDEPGSSEVSSEDWALFRKFGGSITRLIDEKAELAEGLREKYAGAD